MSDELPQTFELQTTNWVKIWFSTDSSQFISKKYQNIEVTMTEMVIDNEDRNFTVVYSSAILNNAGKKTLSDTKKLFHDFTNITFLDIDSPEFQADLQNDTERALYAIAVKELANLGERGGNPAAASDIIRILTPCSRKGIYTDFDVPFKEETIEKIITISSPILFPIAGGKYCNDVIALVPDTKCPLLNKIQQNILDGYSSIGLSRLSASALDCSEDSSHLSNFIDELKRKSLSAEHPEDCIFELRQFLQLQINECQKKGNESSLNFWRSAYINSVMVISGPKNYELACKGIWARPFSFCATSLSDVVTSQVNSHKNDGSWIPAHPSEVMKQNPSSPELNLEGSRKTQLQFKVEVANVRPQETIDPDCPTL